MANFTKKITAQHSQASVTAILARASAQPRLVLHLLWQTLQEKTVQARAFVVAHLKQFLEVYGQRSKVAIESSNSLEILEKSLKRALADSNPAVRESARLLFWDFEQIWQERGHAIMETLDATARKQLEKACPNPNFLTVMLPSTPKPNKKSSVAAAIAASRAKAKAIATAPPTLRHQATSTSHTATPRRSGSPSTSPKNSTARSSSPQRTITSPPSPSRYRVVSASLTRSTSLTSVPISHVRTLSSGSSKVVRAPSPSLSDQSTRRRTSSPLVGSTTTSSIRKALQTALPASPPSSVGQVSPTPISKSKARNVPLPLSQLPTQSLDLANPDESLLIAQTVPIPEGDTDLEDECLSVNLISFSAPFEMYPPIETEIPPLSPDSKFTVSNALSSGSISDMTAGQPVVEDALRARAEQAESAAERLLELVEPEDEGTTHLLFKHSNGLFTAKSKAKIDQIPGARAIAPLATPNNRAATIMRRAALFTDSPAQGMRSSSLLDVLQSQKQETGWWTKRKACKSSRVISNTQHYVHLSFSIFPGLTCGHHRLGANRRAQKAYISVVLW
jgi:CLIP-associating protein 1/2